MEAGLRQVPEDGMTDFKICQRKIDGRAGELAEGAVGTSAGG